MAKSKSGGTRTYLRGRVGSDVYSIGRDSKGKKQQVVRSLAESVSNPQTSAQMRGRMILSTIAQALAVLRPIVDHSFDNVIGAQANLSEFTSRNYGLIKADVAAHPASGNAFGLVAYKEKGAKQGAYVISDGQATIPAALVLTKASGIIAITLPTDAITIGGLKSALGMSSEEYFTMVGLTTEGAANYERFRVNPTLADNTAITSSNIGDVFAVEGNAVASIAIASNVVSITLASVAGCCAVIVSKKASGKYIHNEAVLGDGADFAAPSDAVLPTYPVGNENYLNGGDIFGQQESFNPGGDVPPTPSPTQSSMSGVTVNGASVSRNGQVNLQAGANAIVVSINAGTDGASYGVAVIAKSAAGIGESVAAGSQTSVVGSTVNLSETAVTDGPDKAIVLCRNNVITQVWGTLKEPITPSPTQSSMSGVTVNGANVAQNGQVNLQAGSNAIVVSINAGTDGANYGVAVIDKNAAGIGESVDAGSQTSVAGSTVNLSETAVTDGPDKAIVLCRNNVITQVWGTLKEPFTPSGNTHILSMTGDVEDFEVTVDGNTITSGAAVEDGATVTVRKTASSKMIMDIELNGTSIYSGSTPVTFQMPAQDSTLNMETMDND